MERLSEELTKYIIKAGVVSEESYAVYQYGFQIGLEMLCCFITCLAIAVYLHMVPEFIVFTTIFILLRTYAGGVHLNSFWACYFCSIVVQTLVLIISDIYQLPIVGAWTIIIIGNALILKYAPVQTMNRELNDNEKLHCRKITIKIVLGVFIFAGSCALSGIYKMASLVAWTVVVVWLSQYIGAVKYKIEKSKDMRR